MTDKQVFPGAETKSRKLIPNDEIVIGATVDRPYVDLNSPKSSSIHAIWSSETGSADCTEGCRS